MKKGFLTLILAGSLMSAGAENALTGTKFTDNWSVGINAGVTQPLAHPYSIGETFVRKWAWSFISNSRQCSRPVWSSMPE